MSKDRRESCQVSGPVSLFSSRDCSAISGSPVPRFSLQKRKVSQDSEPAPLTLVNSAFLSGLFADVAEAQSSSTVSVDGSDTPSIDGDRPLKRSRVSFSRSMVRTPTALNLFGDSLPSVPSATPILELIDQALSPTGITEIVKIQGGCVPPLPQDLTTSTKGSARLPTIKVRDNTTSSPLTPGSDAPAFPHLPATISATSCNTLTQNLSDLQSSLAENSEKESYGWFVEMDEEYVHETTTEAYDPSQAPDLAFKAPTAPKADNYDAELEWAKAADTVDDVLGDFF